MSRCPPSRWILINLDIKGPIYREVIEAVVRNGAANDVVAKVRATTADLNDRVAFLSREQMHAVVEAARKAHVRVMANTLSGVVGLADGGGDVDALRDPAGVWGGLSRRALRSSRRMNRLCFSIS